MNFLLLFFIGIYPTPCLQEPQIDIDIEDLIDMIVTHLLGAIEDIIDHLAEVFWAFIPGNAATIFTAALLPLIIIAAMIYPVKIMLERSRA